MTSVEKIDFCGWKDCIRLTDGDTEVIVSTAFGPRMVGLKKGGGDNLMNLFPDTLGKVVKSDGFTIYGGHRVWHAPERADRNYFSDSFKCEVETGSDFVRVLAPVEKQTSTRRGLELSLSGGKITLKNILENHSLFDLKMAVWGITQFRSGGTLVFPTLCPDTGLSANRRISLWPYTDVSDDRITWHNDFIALTPDIRPRPALKMGINSALLKSVYFIDGQAVHVDSLLPFDYDDEYPDQGSNFECYTATGYIEAEWLSPLKVLKTGESVTLLESIYIEETPFPGLNDPAKVLEIVKA